MQAITDLRPTCIALSLPEQLPAAHMALIEQLVYKQGADYLLLRASKQSVLVMSAPEMGNMKLRFRQGMDGLRASLPGIILERIPVRGREIGALLREVLPAGMARDRSDIIGRSGDCYSDEELLRSHGTMAADKKATKRKAPETAAVKRARTDTGKDPGEFEFLVDSKRSMRDLGSSGEVPLMSLPGLQRVRALIETEDEASAYSAKPDLDGTLDLQFQKFDPFGEPIPSVVTTIPLLGLPGNRKIKKKHYWIYSMDASWGKTAVVETQLADKYRATILNDPRNAMGIPRDAQFLILDEVSPTKNVPLSTMKALTSGNASSSALNRKSYGKSYTPRADAQFVLMGNSSPYETYASRDKLSGRHTMSKAVLTTLEDRFHIYRLDGDNYEEKVKYVDMHLMTAAEYGRLQSDLIYGRSAMTNSQNCLWSIDLRRTLDKALQFHRSRHPKHDVNLCTFRNELVHLVRAVDLPVIYQVLDAYGTDGHLFGGQENFKVHLKGGTDPFMSARQTAV